jgi:hypothetical protein
MHFGSLIVLMTCSLLDSEGLRPSEIEVLL